MAIADMFNVSVVTAQGASEKAEILAILLTVVMGVVDKKYFVYKHTLFDGRVYIGITSCKNPKTRWQGGNGYRGNSYFSNAIKKYGWSAFKHDILFYDLSEKEAKEKEIELIRFYKSNKREYGFNISSGGESKAGVSISDWQKQRISEASKGRIISKETRHKLSETTKENWKNPAFVQHMREINTGEKNPQFGRKRTDEEKRIRGARGIIQKDFDGNIIGKYISLHDASNSTNISRDLISKCCRGIYKQGKGFLWEFDNG